ncbi:phosphoglycolate phosphatase [Caldimonas brevitalea]|uniref:Phosphoglycolate phosphatase n=1 Tax=Caldimonas brevitalea TaxID=413882 RepID=A0A0G3BLU8_9BURK|nr:phosphoglycolate phosphatase [Caldimonas brevitalea]AKJ30414.1 phosphoglycolate phosphatase [Caldimonas brevitalea]
MTSFVTTDQGARWAPRAVLFDLDGTLADTAPDLGGAVNRMRVRRGLPPLPLEQLRPVASAGARGMLAVGLGVSPAQADYEALRDEFLAEYESALDVDSVLFDGAAAVLQALTHAGIAWGVVTNKAMRFTGPVLEGLGLAATASVVIGGDTTPHSKPHPAPLLEACRRLQIEPGQALYVGDDLRDMEAARAAGMPAVAAAYGYLGETPDLTAWRADAVIAHLLQLLPLIGVELPSDDRGA